MTTTTTIILVAMTILSVIGAVSLIARIQINTKQSDVKPNPNGYYVIGVFALAAYAANFALFYWMGNKGWTIACAVLLAAWAAHLTYNIKISLDAVKQVKAA